jgi:serine protease Do
MSPSLRTIVLSAAVSFSVALGTVAALKPASSTLIPPAAFGGDTANIMHTASRDIAAEESSVIATIERAEPAVVSVIIRKDIPVTRIRRQETPFGYFDFPQIDRDETQSREVGGGTAFFVSKDGLLMTNKHVVSDEQADYSVLLNDGRELDATVVARDPLTDIALIKVSGNNFPALAISPNDHPSLGQTAIAIGNALGEFSNTVSVGVVSGLQRSIVAGGRIGGDTERLSRIIQTDAAINEGNSGGPLLGLDGTVIGMNTAVATGAQNIGFALPAVNLRRALESFEKNGKILRPYIGVRYTLVTPELQKLNNLQVDHGMLIQRGETPADLAVIPGSPADKAGLRENDIILSIDGKELNEDYLLSDAIAGRGPGETLTLGVSSQGKERFVSVTLEEWKQ